MKKRESKVVSLDPVWEASEDELALSFSNKHADRLRYVAKWARWYEWTGQRWAEDETVHVFDLVRNHCRDAVALVDDAGKRKAAAKAATIAAVERLTRADRRHAATSTRDYLTQSLCYPVCGERRR